jgi:hypothetical protein
VAADTAALARLDARLRQLRGENIMATADTISVEVRAIPTQRVATITRQAPGFGNENIGPVIGPIFPTVAGTLERAGVRPDGYGPDRRASGSPTWCSRCGAQRLSSRIPPPRVR